MPYTTGIKFIKIDSKVNAMQLQPILNCVSCSGIKSEKNMKW